MQALKIKNILFYYDLKLELNYHKQQYWLLSPFLVNQTLLYSFTKRATLKAEVYCVINIVAEFFGKPNSSVQFH